MTMSRLWLTLAVALPVLAALVANLPSVDLTYHLRAGGEILDGYGIPDRDTWTYTAPGAPWFDQQWGAQLILASVERTLGWTGLVLLRAACIGVTFGSLAWMARRTGLAARWVALLVLAGFVVAAVALGLRPQLFGMAIFALVLVAVTERHNHPRWLWAVPLLTIVWANVHGSFFLAPLTLGLAWLQDLHDGAPARHRALVIAFLSAIAACLTPFGPSVWGYAVGLSTNPAVLERITEWQPTSLRSIPGVLFFASVLAVAAFLARRGRPTEWPRLAWLATFAAIGAFAIRGVAWWPLAAVPVVAALLAADLAGVPVGASLAAPTAAEPRGTTAMRRANLVIVALLGLVGIALLPVWRPIDPGTGAPLGVVGYAPSGVTAAVRDAAQPGDRLFHPQIWGSWFEYRLPTLPTAIDSRIEVMPIEVWDDYAVVSDGVAGWDAILDRWDVSIVVTIAGQDDLETRLLDDGWILAYRDAEGAVFTRPERA